MSKTKSCSECKHLFQLGRRDACVDALIIINHDTSRGVPDWCPLLHPDRDKELDPKALVLDCTPGKEIKR